MNMGTFARSFYASHYIPVTLYRDGTPVRAVGLEDSIADPIACRKLLEAEKFPAVCAGRDELLYGMVRCPDEDEALLLGPAGGQSDQISYNQFLNLLAFLHLALNGEKIDVAEHFAVAGLGYLDPIAARYVSEAYVARDEGQTHGTYLFEQQMLEYIKRGDTTLMKNFLVGAAQSRSLTEGRVAHSPLRQAKNIFIGSVTLVGKFGAIPGGLDVEETYRLIDIYIQECEKLTSIDDIKNLQFNMVMDFTGRVSLAKRSSNLSPEIHSCVQYIAAHINEAISLDDVAAAAHRSRAWLTTHFRRETGQSVSAYIMDERLQEALILLKYTDMSIGEISAWLSFSSQPYFSNVFKKRYGITPAQYRVKGIQKEFPVQGE